MTKALSRKQILAGFGGKRRQSLAKHGKHLNTPADHRKSSRVKSGVKSSAHRSVKRRSTSSKGSTARTVLAGLAGLAAGGVAGYIAARPFTQSELKSVVARIEAAVSPEEAIAIAATNGFTNSTPVSSPVEIAQATYANTNYVDPTVDQYGNING